MRVERHRMVPDNSAASPRVIGIDRHPQQIVTRLGSDISVVIFGPLGFGKTFLLDSVVRRLSETSPRPVRIIGTMGASSEPFGSLLHGPNLTLAEALAGASVTTGRILSYFQQVSAVDRPVVLVDDAHLLDAHTMRSLSQLVATQAITLLAASDLVPHAALLAIDRTTTHLLAELWIKGDVERIDLEPLTAPESADLVQEFAPGTQFDRVTQALLHDRSGGSRVLLRELTAEAARQQPPLFDLNRTAFAFLVPSRRITDLLTHQLLDLAPAQLVTLSLIAALHKTTYARALMLSNPADLSDLIRRGHVHHLSGQGNHVQGHTMLAEAALAQIDSALLRETTKRLVEVLLTDRSHGFATTPAEAQLIARSWIQCSDLEPGVSEKWGQAVVADILLMAARRSRSVGQPEQALLYAGLSLGIEPGLKSTIEYSRALAATGRYSAALAIIAPADTLVVRPSDGVKLVRWLVSLAKFSPLTAAEYAAFSTRVAGWLAGDITMRGEGEYIRLTQAMQCMDWVRVAREGEFIANNADYNVVTRIRAACLSSIGHAHEGRTQHGLALLELATTLNRRDRGQRNADIYSSEGLALEIFQSKAALRCMSGLNVASLTDELNRWILVSVADHDLGKLGILGFISARLLDFRGDTVGTEAELRMAHANLIRSDPCGWLPWVQSLHASSLARLGLMQAAAAKMACAQASAEPTGDDALSQFESDYSDLQFLMHSGRIVAARGLAHRLLESADGQAPLIRSWLFDTLVALGEPTADIAVHLERIAATTDSPIVLAMAHRTRAAAAIDAEAMDGAASHLAELGAYGMAASASIHAARLHEQRADSLSEHRSQARAEHYAATSGSSGEDLRQAPERSSLDALTTREREITTLAGQGLSNREIATKLYLSVRTIESHLYQARIKTGQSPRGIGREPDPSPDLSDAYPLVSTASGPAQFDTLAHGVARQHIDHGRHGHVV